MREINKVDMAKMQKAEVKFSSADKNDAPPAEDTSTQEIKDFSNPTEVLGRSQVNKSDNLKSDLGFSAEHPEILSSSDKLFDLAFESLSSKGDPNAYEKACAIATSQEAKDLLVK